MAVARVQDLDFAETAAEDVLKRLNAQPSGLSSEEAARRLEQYGPNELEEKRVSALRKLLGYFWGPIAWMIEIAALLSAIVGHWADLVIILVMLCFNAGVGFWQEYQAGNAIEQLKKSLALKARVLRDGKWGVIPARNLVPGDIVRLRLGDVIPADTKLLDGDYLSVDQSALTGESLPVDKKSGDVGYSGSVVKQGEMNGVVVATGAESFFGKTAQLVNTAKNVSHFQKAVLTIGDYLIYLSLGLVGVLLLVGVHRGLPLLQLAQFALILTVASIPVAMPAVLSVTMAVGAVALSRMKAIVSRLESIEEMAGMDILCSDKTGTLTENQLALGDAACFEADDKDELIRMGVLASKAEDADAIDTAILQGLDDHGSVQEFRQERFKPFDPVGKRTEADVVGPDGGRFTVSKGAPQVILDLCGLNEETRAKADAAVDAFAEKGYRTLGVSRKPQGGSWSFLGLLTLSDPPRADAAGTIKEAQAHGISVKMVTGDNIAIARQIGGELGLGTNIVEASRLKAAAQGGNSVAELEAADGFAEVFPEHKYTIVKSLQSGGHLVAMTGDGVNDAPALKQAEVGIAVSGATDAARAAADLVLTAPGLHVIVRAVEEARRIFERMNSYAIYRITETIRIMIFMVLAMLVYNMYPITAIMIILLALLNDIPIMTIAKDNTWLDPQPVRWDMRRVLTIASVLGGIGVIETFLLLVIAKSWFNLPASQLQSIIFLKLAVAGHMTLFVARSKHAFYSRPFPAKILLGAVLGTQAVAALIVGFGVFVTAVPWSYIGLVWAYCIAWIFIEDSAKRIVYRHLEMGGPRHLRFVALSRLSLHSHGHDRY